MNLEKKYQQIKEIIHKTEFSQNRDNVIFFIEIMVKLIPQSISRIQLEEYINITSKYASLFSNYEKRFFKELLDKTIELKHVSNALKIDVDKKYFYFYNIDYGTHNNNVNKNTELYKWFRYKYNNVEKRFKNNS